MARRRRKQTREKPSTTANLPATTDQPPESRAAKPGRTALLLIIAGILLLGLALRLCYLGEIVKAPDFSYPAFDAAFHDHWARGLVTGDLSPPEHFSDPQIHRTPFFRPPAYPCFLALVYSVAGQSYLAPRIIQMALGLVNCLLAFFLGRAVFGRCVGLIFAGLMSCYWVFIYFEGELLAPVLLVFLSLSLMNVLVRWADRTTRFNTFAGGLLLGVLALARPNALLFAPLVLIWIYWITRRRPQSRSMTTPFVWFPLGLALAIAPATIRNYIVADEFVFITSNAGVNLYIGNNEKADCVTAHIPILTEFTTLTGWTCFDQPAIARGVESIEGRSLRASEVSSFFTRKAVDYMVAHPLDVMRLTIKKALLFWGPAEISNNKVIHYERANSRTLNHLPGFPMALSLAVMGAVMFFAPAPLRSRDDRRSDRISFAMEASILIALFIAAIFASHLPFFIAGRYRVPVIPFLLLFGAYGLCRIGMMVAERHVRRTLLWSGAWCAVYIVTAHPLVDYTPNLGTWHFDRGDAYRKQGRIEYANTEFRLAIAQGDWQDPRAYNNLGAGLLHEKHYEEAAARFEEALNIKPDYVEARRNLANALAIQGKIAESVPHFVELVKLTPDDFDVRYNLGTIVLRLGEHERAVTHLAEAVGLDPHHVYAHNNLALALTRVDRIDDAIEHYKAALRLKPDLSQAHWEVARLLVHKGFAEQAIAHLESVLQIEPNHAAASRLLERLQP